MKPVWINSEFTLFKRSGDKAIYLPLTQLDRMNWIDLRNTRARLTGMLPEAEVLLDIENDDTIDIVYMNTGPRDLYDKDSIVFYIEGIKVLRKYICNLSPISVDDQEVTQVHVSFKGKLVICN